MRGWMGGRTKERTFYIEDCQFGVRLKEFGPAAGQDWARAGPCQGRGAGGGRRWRVRELAQRVPRGVQPMAAPVTSGAGGHTPATPMRAPRRPPVGWLDEGGFVTLTASELSPSSARTRLTGHAARPPEACDSTRLTQSESGVYRHNQLRRLYCPRGETAPLPFGDTHTPATSNPRSVSVARDGSRTGARPSCWPPRCAPCFRGAPRCFVRSSRCLRSLILRQVFEWFPPRGPAGGGSSARVDTCAREEAPELPGARCAAAAGQSGPPVGAASRGRGRLVAPRGFARWVRRPRRGGRCLAGVLTCIPGRPAVGLLAVWMSSSEMWLFRPCAHI